MECMSEFPPVWLGPEGEVEIYGGAGRLPSRLRTGSPCDTAACRDAAGGS